jgi:hypothetical protein
VYELAKEYNPIAVMSDECDIATPTVAWVSEKLGKPSIGMELADLYTDKYKMRVFAKENGFATPVFYKCYSLEETVDNYNAFGKKMIMKPLDGNSSRGVFSIENEMEVKKYFEKSLQYSKREKCVLLEEYIEGEEFSVDGIMTNTGYYSMALAKKKHYSNNENLDQELIFKYKDETYDYDELRDINRRYVEKTGLEFGLTHAEYKYHAGQFYLIEIGARGGGNLISGVINPNLTGIESQELLIDWSIGNLNNQNEIHYVHGFENKCAVLSFFDVGDKNGIVKKIVGLDYLENNEKIKSFYLDYSEGDVVKAVEDGGNRFGYYIACCDSLESLNALRNEIAKNVIIVIE